MMLSDKKNALQYIAQKSGNCNLNRVEVESSIKILQDEASNQGLSEDEIHQLVEFLTNTKLTSSLYISLFSCLIPHTKVLNKTIEEILFWFFKEVGKEKSSQKVEKKFIQWLTGVIYYELIDNTIIDCFYHSFLFLLKRPHLESLTCRLLCLISKPEDARRWVVQQVLNIQSLNGSKPHTNSFLSLLKSYRSDAVPEKIPTSSFCFINTAFDDSLKKAHSRKLEKNIQSESTENLNSLQWNSWKIYDGRSKNLTRLIPSAESLIMNNRGNEKKIQSIMDFNTMASLGFHPLHIECPAQSLSLLSNLAGYHVLAFSSETTKTRFSHKLYHTLNKVFLLELEPYSEKEKIYFLNSIKELEEYTQQSISVVTTFLYNYLLVWDGEEYRKEILGLIEWVEIRDEKDLEKYIFPPLKQIFISTGTHCKCLIIETMGKLMKNLLIMDKREKNYFRSEFQEGNIIKCIEAIGNFVSGLIVKGLIWNNEKTTRNILMSALDFYETSQAVEQAGDLPIIMIMPPMLVYNCLFSGSRICIARLCSLLLRLQIYSIERLYLLGVFQDFSTEVQQLNVYLLDFYRCLWSNINFRKNEYSFCFHDNNFCEIFWKLKENYGNEMEKIFGIEYNFSFWNPQSKGIREVILSQLAEDYPSIVRLKQETEERLLKVE